MENKTIDKAKKYIMSTYASFPLVFERGEGCYLFDDSGKKYLDFVSGIAVNALGYGHERFIEAVGEQLKKLTHISNLYYNEPAVKLAEKLSKYSGLDKVFFCNSGAEAVEAALKLSRVYCKKNKSKDAYKIVSMKNSFHGRTFGAISATGQLKYQKDLDPMMPQVDFAEFNDIEDLKSKISPETAAVIVEPIQGEGGINPAQVDYLKAVRKLCDDNNIILIFDEVQSGIGRTGDFFAYQKYGVVPDIVTCAKGLGGGIPMGAIIAKEEVAQAFTPGSHASTFGGNALSASAALVVVEELMENGLIENVKKQGAYLREKLENIKNEHPEIKEVKGAGLMMGVSLEGIAPVEVVKNAMEKGLLLVGAGSDVIRFVPPLTVGKKEIDEFIGIFTAALEDAK
ncbi:acetylornithine transaminase [Alkalibacter saccharofermentans]|uniref:Acetylornithine aminotransferase n=1 Tax=Alkalibacter saccharofermentans DSM 14828 TaxID=1120975 RepID=A0A1M4UBR6_9FIRM|nr:acetylornithine transaminase [Alkalibacter saccharofermentans]SHE54301.1 acetylornithine/N-succinyldiaminopimelate aminotransferase [Alkalibacter saccharofermentans DSM 14828]